MKASIKFVLLIGSIFLAFYNPENIIASTMPPHKDEARFINVQHTDARPVIVAFGDSLTAGYEVAPHQAYPAILEKMLAEEGWPYQIINAGISGDTTAGGVRRIDFVLRHQPDIVILELGANDGLRGLPLSQIEQNLSTIIEQLQKNGVTVVLAGMKVPPNYGKPYSEGFEQIFHKLARQYQLTLIPFFLSGVAGNRGLTLPDGLHPTAKGYELIAGQIYPILKPILKKARTPSLEKRSLHKHMDHSRPLTAQLASF